jgi:hypothetical protein
MQKTAILWNKQEPACTKHLSRKNNTDGSTYNTNGHPGDQKLVAIEDRWLLRTDCFNRECAAKSWKQTNAT